MRYQKIISAALMLSVLASCGETAQANNNLVPADTSSAETTQAELPDQRCNPNLEMRNLDGKVIKLFSCAPDGGGNWHIHDMIAEELDGDVINDAIFYRNHFLDETYGFTFELTTVEHEDPVSDIRALVSSGDTTYDTFGLRSFTAAALSLEGLLMNMRGLPYLNLDESWWAPSLSEAVRIGDRQHMATGDITVVPKEGVRAFYFNKDLQKDYGLESPYDLVDSNAWTIDKMFSMMHSTVADLDGDGRMNKNDRWGLQGQSLTSGVLFFGSGESLIVNDNDEIWRNALGDEKSLDAMIKVSDMISQYKSDISFNDDWRKMLTMFENDQAMFYTEVMLHIATMRGFEVDFGIIPTPKTYESLDGYSHFIDSNCTIFYTLPINAADPETTAYILEETAYASQYDITPAYYDICLKTKFSRDDDSSRMLDIIFSTYRLEIGDVYKIASVFSTVTGALKSGKDITSSLAKIKSKVNADIEARLTQYMENNP